MNAKAYFLYSQLYLLIKKTAEVHLCFKIKHFCCNTPSVFPDFVHSATLKAHATARESSVSFSKRKFLNMFQMTASFPHRPEGLNQQHLSCDAKKKVCYLTTDSDRHRVLWITVCPAFSGTSWCQVYNQHQVLQQDKRKLPTALLHQHSGAMLDCRDGILLTKTRYPACLYVQIVPVYFCHSIGLSPKPPSPLECYIVCTLTNSDTLKLVNIPIQEHKHIRSEIKPCIAFRKFTTPHR